MQTPPVSRRRFLATSRAAALGGTAREPDADADGQLKSITKRDETFVPHPGIHVVADECFPVAPHHSDRAYPIPFARVS